jgi:glutathione synthase/RimK-type ligase-like ATP-grasp enzyme
MYFTSDAFPNDVALVNACANNLDSFRIKKGILRMSEVVDSNVYLNMNSHYNVHGFRNYSVVLTDFLRQIERQSNRVFPSSKESELWENKVLMHDVFDKVGIKSPETGIIDLDNIERVNIPFDYPFLIKEVHSSGSKGVHKVSNKNEFDLLLSSNKIRRKNKHVLIQRLLNMDRDLRVIIIGKEIVLHYWRINYSNYWKPTSTKHGSGVDFDYFPEEWRNHILHQFQKLNIHTGAFDIVWEGNDYSKEPYFLEVSPSYQPNPLPPKGLKKSYGQFKKDFQLRNGWDSEFIKLIQQTKDRLIKAYLNN